MELLFYPAVTQMKRGFTVFTFLAALSSGYADHGRVEVSVVGGYTDVRGDAARNSLSLLK